jgi:hypothetical protein
MIKYDLRNVIISYCNCIVIFQYNHNVFEYNHNLGQPYKSAGWTVRAYKPWRPSMPKSTSLLHPPRAD